MFHNLFSPITTGLASIFLSISMFFSGGSGAQLGAIQPAADFRTSLTSGITAAATTMTLVSTSTPSGEYLTQGKTYGFKLGGREYVLGTLSAGRQITSLTRGVSLITGTTTGGVAEAWGRGTAVEITDAPILLQISNKVSGTEYFDNALTYAQTNTTASTSNQIPAATWIYNNFMNTSEAQSINGVKTFTSLPTIPLTPSATTDAASKGYVDGVAIAGAPNADTVTKGIVEIATQAEVNAGTATGGTGASIVVRPDTLIAYTASSTYFSTTTLQNMSTTTIRSTELPAGNNLKVVMTIPNLVGQSTTTPAGGLYLQFNSATDQAGTAYFVYDLLAATGENKAASGVAKLLNGVSGGFVPQAANPTIRVFKFDVNNSSASIPKFGDFSFQVMSTTTGSQDSGLRGNFTWATTTTKITSIDIFTGGAVDKAAFATGTTLTVFGY